jgi:hypothetical protein
MKPSLRIVTGTLTAHHSLTHAPAMHTFVGPASLHPTAHHRAATGRSAAVHFGAHLACASALHLGQTATASAQPTRLAALG